VVEGLLAEFCAITGFARPEALSKIKEFRQAGLTTSEQMVAAHFDACECEAEAENGRAIPRPNSRANSLSSGANGGGQGGDDGSGTEADADADSATGATTPPNAPFDPNVTVDFDQILGIERERADDSDRYETNYDANIARGDGARSDATDDSGGGGNGGGASISSPPPTTPLRGSMRKNRARPSRQARSSSASSAPGGAACALQ